MMNGIRLFLFFYLFFSLCYYLIAMDYHLGIQLSIIFGRDLNQIQRSLKAILFEHGHIKLPPKDLA